MRERAQACMRGLIVVLWATACGVAVAATPQSSLNNLFQCQLRQHELLTQYHIFAADSGDPSNRSAMQKAQAAAAACVTQVDNDLRASNLAAQGASIRGKYQAFSTATTRNLDSIAKQGSPENEVLSEMVRYELDLQTAMEVAQKDLQASSQYKLKPAVAQARQLAVLIQYANARYVERTTSAFGLSFRDDSREKSIDELAREFAKGLQQLRANAALPADSQAKLAGVLTRWRFIEGSLLNYNEKTVPFTVNRHTRSIVALLDEVASSLEAPAAKAK